MCSNCPRITDFEFRDSKTFHALPDGNARSLNFGYGSGMVKAFQGWDTVCLDDEGQFCGKETMFGNVVYT